MKMLVEEVELNAIDASEPDLNDYHPIPDHIVLSDQIKVISELIRRTLTLQLGVHARRRLRL